MHGRMLHYHLAARRACATARILQKVESSGVRRPHNALDTAHGSTVHGAWRVVRGAWWMVCRELLNARCHVERLIGTRLSTHACARSRMHAKCSRCRRPQEAVVRLRALVQSQRHLRSAGLQVAALSVLANMWRIPGADVHSPC